MGNHECSKSPSILNEDGTTRAAGSEVSLVKVPREETGVNTVRNLPQHNLNTSVVVDVMHDVRHWSFHKDQTLYAVAWRYSNMILRLYLGPQPTPSTAVHR